MATSNSVATISKRLYRTLLSNHKPYNHILNSSFSTTPELEDEFSNVNFDSESTNESLDASSTSSSPGLVRQKVLNNTILEGGLDVGIYKAILVGQIGQSPLQKRLKSGKMLTLTTVGTGGIRNERIPFPNEEPREYADRCNVQWHRVAVYPDWLGDIVMKNAKPGAIVYLEGNLETKIFTDQITGLVRRIREIAVRVNGRIVFLGNDSHFSEPSPNELRGTGYF